MQQVNLKVVSACNERSKQCKLWLKGKRYIINIPNQKDLLNLESD